MRSRWAWPLALSTLTVGLVGCGSDICDEARTAFCEKACDCPEGGCSVRLNQAGLQVYDTFDECMDLAGPQVCDSDGTEEAADACTQAVAEMDACGGSVAPEACTPFPDQGSGEP
jgi:hypothetical protein